MSDYKGGGSVKIFRNILLWAAFIGGVLACWYQTLYTLIAAPNNEGSIIVFMYEENAFYWYRDFFGWIIISMLLVAVYSMVVMKIVKIPQEKICAHRYFKAVRVLRAEFIYLIFPLYSIIAMLAAHSFP